MSFTKEQIENMEERPLREQVLIPLFQRMGFNDVYHYDGGPGEKGKDIVMWTEGKVGERINYAVVVKSKKVSGKASGTNSAGDVCTQIQQVFGRNYPDPITGEERRVDHCYIVSSKEIKKEAEDSILSILERSNLNRLITFIGGDTLWRLIEQYLSERTVLYRLAQIKKICDEADPYYRIVPIMDGNTISLTIKAKDPSVIEKHPLTIPARFIFPNTPEGQAKRKEFESFLDKGTRVVLSSEYIEKFELPEFLSRFMAPPNKNARLVLGSKLQPVLVKIEIEGTNGYQAGFDYIPLVPLNDDDLEDDEDYVEPDELKFSNEKQLVPWKVTLIFNRKEKKINFSYQIAYEGINVNWGLQAARFERAISKGGILRIIHLETDTTIIEQQITQDEKEEDNTEWNDILEGLLFIQRKTGVLFNAPTGLQEPREMARIFSIANILETGRISYKPPIGQQVVPNPDFAQQVLEMLKSGNTFSYDFTKEDVVKLLGKEINLGPAHYTYTKLKIAEDDIERLKEALETSFPEEGVKISLVPLEDCEAQVEFLNWLPNTETSIPSHNQEEVQSD